MQRGFNQDLKWKKQKQILTLMSTSCTLDKDDGGRKYRGMVGFLLYLTTSRLDTMFYVSMYARFQAKSKEINLTTIKCIMRYLTSIPLMSLWYPKGASCDLVRYSDSNFVGCKLDRKSITGTCHFIGNSLISLHSKKQANVVLSITDA